jgi:tetratricopeptide (TPR) repeat protein
MVELAAEAARLLEGATPDAAVVDAYGQLANANAVAGRYPEAIEAANRALRLARMLGQDPPARSLGYRGFAHALMGASRGLDEMEEALVELTQSGSGREAAVLQNNLALARYPLQGPEHSLAAFESAIAFSEKRGLGESRALLEGNVPGLLAELGRIDEALARAARVAAACEASGDVHTLSEVHSVEATCQLARGHPAGLSVSADWLVQAAEDSGAADIIVMTLATAASIIVSEDPERAVALLVKLERVPGVRETPYSPRRLPEMVRTALVARSPHVGAALIDRIPNRYPLDEHASCAARASLAEHTGELEAAEDLFT